MPNSRGWLGPCGWGVAAACLGAAGLARGVAGQAPGYQQLPIGQVRAEYVAEVLSRVAEVDDDWADRWNGDEIEGLLELYWEDALLIAPDGTTRRGTDALRTYFAQALPEQSEVEAFLLDFDASGQMAQVFGAYRLTTGGIETRGRLFTVYVRRGRRWKIRSQLFMGLETDRAGGGA